MESLHEMKLLFVYGLHLAHGDSLLQMMEFFLVSGFHSFISPSTSRGSSFEMT